jgi:hypothetical protein
MGAQRLQPVPHGQDTVQLNRDHTCMRMEARISPPPAGIPHSLEGHPNSGVPPSL